jgi:sugar lactone lactonase YvrE
MSSVSRRIQVRRDTAENWTSINPILADGEIGYETTGFKRMKVGDGRTRWAVLAYFNVGPTGKLGPTGPIGLPGEASNTGATGPTGVPGLSSGVTFQLNYTSAGPIAYSTAVTTLAGSSQGLANDPGTAARFYNPSATAVDSSGIVYVADTENNCIRRITSAGLVTTFAGDGTPGAKDGSGSNAQFNSPSAITITSAGVLYVSDAGNHRIRRITSTGVVSTFAGSTSGFQDGIGTNAQFDSPQGIVVDSLGNVFVADANNHRIRIITSAGQVSTFAGQATSGITNDSGTSAKFNTPTGLAIDSAGNLYVADKNNHRIRKVTPQASVSTLAGSTAGFTNNTGTAAQFSSPVGIAVDSTGTLYVADTGNHRIRTVSSSGVVTTFVGLSTSGNANGTPSQAQFSSPYSITVGTTGVFYVADYGNHRIRKIVVTASDPNEYGFTPFTGTLMTPLNSLPTSSSYIVVPERKTDTHVATFTIPISGMPSTTSIVGQWVLGLNASVALSSSPGSFYFEALDGTSSIVVGTSNRVAQTTSGVILATMTVPARTYATSLTLKLFVTTRDLSPMTIRFNGSTLSYLNTTIINVGPTGATGPHLFTIFNKLNHRVITSITDKSDELFANSNLTFNGSNLNVVNTVTTSNFRGQGTVSTPPYAFTGDVTSGMFLPSESNLAFTTAGVERMRITTGNVGIATPTPGFTLDVSGTANVSGNLSVGTISTSGGGFSVPGNLTGGIIRSSSNGTAAVPAYTFSNDLTTGTFLPSVSNLALTTAGVERVRVLPNGNVGIGTTAPGFTLDVTGTANVSGNLTGGIIRTSSNGTAALPAYTFSNDLTTGAFLPAVSNLALTTAGVERVRILPSGNVGIGTTTPGFTLDVTGTANISGNLSVGSITTAGGGFSVPGNLTGAIIRSSSNGTASQPVYTFSSDLSSGLFIPFTGGLGYATAGRERMTITSSGRVGIGNSDPINTLDVTGNASVSSNLTGAIIRTSSDGTASAPAHTFSTDLSTGVFLPTASNLALTTAGVERMRILPSGNVGVGITAPTERLHVSGNAIVSGTLSSGATTVTSLAAGSGAITTTGTLSGGTTTVTSLAAGSGAITTTGTLSAGATTVTSLSAGSGAITTTGSLAAGTTTVGSLAAYVSSVLTSSLPNYTAACRGENNTIYVVGGFFGDVYSISTSGVVTAIAYSTVSAYPTGIAYYDGSVYVVDSQSSQIKKVVISNGVVTTFAGSSYGFTDNVAGTNAQFSAPQGIAVDSQGNLYVLDTGNRRIRKITTAAVVSTVAGTGTPVYADGVGGSFRIPTQILSTSTGDLWVVDTNSSNVRVIRYVTVSTGEIRTLDTSGTLATNPTTPYNVDVLNGFAIDPADVLYIISDTTLTKRQGNTLTSVSLGITTNFGAIVTSLFDILAFNIGPVVRRFSPGSLSGGSVSATSLNTGTITASGALTAASASITNVTLTNINGSKYFAGGASGRTFQLNYSTGVAGFTVTNFKTGLGGPYGTALDSAGIVYVADNHRVQKIASDGTTTLLAGSTSVGSTVNQTGANASFYFIKALTIDSSGSVYVNDGIYQDRLRKITSSGYVTALATLANYTYGITVDSSGNVYSVNASAHTIQKTTSDGTVTTFAGGAGGSSYGYGNGSGNSALFYSPQGIVVDSAGNLYVADTNNHRIRKVTSSGVASLVAGSGTAGNSDGTGALATFNNPSKITINSTGTTLYVGDFYSVRKIVIATGEVTTLAGSATNGNTNGVGASASFANIQGIAVTSNEELYVTDHGTNSVRKLSAKSESTYSSTTLTGGSLSTEFDPRTTLGSVIVPAATTNAKVVSFSIPARYPSMSSITGQWLLGLYATVGLSTSPASVYFEIMDGTTSVANGSTSPTSINLSTPLQLYTASLFVPSRTYSSNLILNLYVTTQASSSLTLQFSGPTLSYLNTTIQPYNDVVVANDYQLRASTGILKLLSMSVLAITDNSNNVYTPLCYSSVERDLKNSFANYQLAPGCRLIVNTGSTIHLDVTNSGTEWTFTAASVTVTGGTTKYKLYPVTL